MENRNISFAKKSKTKTIELISPLSNDKDIIDSKKYLKKDLSKDKVSTIHRNKNIIIQNKKYCYYRSHIGTPQNKSTIMSYISTPNEKSYMGSLDKVQCLFPMTIKNSISQSIKNSIQKYQQYTEDQTISQNIILINFIIQKKILKSQFSMDVTYKEIENFIIKDILDNGIKNKYVGMLGVQVCPCGRIFGHGDDEKFEKFIKNCKQITLKVLLCKQAISYKFISLKNFQIIKYLGNGGFSIVYLAKCLIDHKYCALKFINKDTISTPKKIRMLENQKNILFQIKHKNLIDLYYAFQTDTFIVFGLEYCQYGNLYTYLQKLKTIEENIAKRIFRQILSGIQYLHQHHILFRDIKLQNILIDSQGNIKITDFGLSKPSVTQDQITYSYCGSPQYMAPQMLAKEGHSYEVDYYALGILLYELLYGKSPFFANKKQDIFYGILNLQPKFPKIPVVTSQAKSLIRGLLAKNPKRRIGSLNGIRQIVGHPWLRNNQNQSISSLLALNNGENTYENSQSEKIIKLFEQQKKKNNFEKYFLSESYVNQAYKENILRKFTTFKTVSQSKIKGLFKDQENKINKRKK